MMYTNLYVYKAPRLFMSGKLYWRIKKDGKWTWKPVFCRFEDGICMLLGGHDCVIVHTYQGEEE